VVGDPHLASSHGTRDVPSAFWSGVLVVIERKTDFTLSCESRQDQACLIECEFGEFGSKNQTSAPAPSLAALTPVSVELKRLSTTTMIPRLSAAARTWWLTPRGGRVTGDGPVILSEQGRRRQRRGVSSAQRR